MAKLLQLKPLKLQTGSLQTTQPAYQAPAELSKTDAGAKLGIRLAWDERPRIVSLNPDLIAAKSAGLAVNDVILTVNGQAPDKTKVFLGRTA